MTAQVIAIDALGIGEPGGGRSATLNVLREMLRLDSERRYLLLLSRAEPELGNLGGRAEQVVAPVGGRMVSRLWAQAAWPLLLRRRGVRLVHHMKNLTTLGLPGASLATVYDLTTLLHPQFYTRADVLYWRYAQPAMLRRVDRIVAISEETRRDLQRFWGLDSGKVRVIYPAYDQRYRPLGAEEVERVRERYGTGARFVLHVGSLSLRKNLLPLLRAYERLRERGYEGKLVLAGRQYPKGCDERFYAHLRQSSVRADVILTGSVPQDDLPALYNAAELVVYPSLHEGFGIVALEAMACGVPLIASRAGALPEVAGDAALLLRSARDPEEIATLAERVLGDDELRSRLVARGLAWVKRYSPVEAARQTLSLYDELLPHG